MADSDLLPLDAIPWRGAAALLGRALRRYWVVVVLTFVTFTAAAVAAASFLPRTFAGETRLLVRKGTSVMSAVTDPRRAIVPGFDQPGQGAVELALSRSALDQVVREARLVEHFRANRPKVLAWVDAVRTMINGPMSDADAEDAVRGLLAARLRVGVENEVVSMRVTWWDADGVALILTNALAAYLAERERLDIETLAASHAILLSAVLAGRSDMSEGVVGFQRARARVIGSTATTVRARPVTTQTVGQLRDRLLERRAYREEMERQRRQRSVALEVQLAQQEETLGPAHPDRIATERALAGLNTEDAALRRARAEEGGALDAFVSAGGSLDIFADAPVDEAPLEQGAVRVEDDPTVIAARAELRIRVDGYQDMTMRLENARLELETARAALPFRYVVTHPPERPRRPVAPNVAIIVLGGLVAGALSGALLALALAVRAEARAAGRNVLAQLASLHTVPNAVHAAQPVAA